MRKAESRPIITLTTDFGLHDDYVGTVKGVILCTCRDAVIVDLTHDIEPQNIVAAAMSIGASFRFFPGGTLHIVVVDPGVGSDRRILAVRSAGHLFVAPDNGVLTPVLTEDAFQEAFQVNNRDLFATTISASFHGRDIMAPVAAGLACGMDISLVGPRLSRQQCCRISLPAAIVTHGNLTGKIIHIDRFGNLRTSITAEDLAAFSGKQLQILVGGQTLNAVNGAYSDAETGHLVALIDSRNHLEIAVVGGNAAKRLGCHVGDGITVSRSDV